MRKYSVNSITTLTFCCAMIDFLTFSYEGFLFPRDRIFHITISSFVAIFSIYVLQYIDYDKMYVRILLVGFAVYRMVSIYLKFIDYFSTFHGSNKVAITILTAFLILTICKFMGYKNYEIYIFFIMLNVVSSALIILLSLDQINTMNLYSNDISFSFKYNKLPIFWELLAIPTFFEDKNDRINSSKKYVIITTSFMIIATLLQGLCVQGNILYSAPPLQSIMQIFTTETVRRFDYILTIFQTFNYFGAIMLYTWLLKGMYTKIKGVQK